MMRNLPAHFQKFQGKSRPVVSTCLYGLIASLAAVAFQLAITWIYRRLYLIPSEGAFWTFAWTSLAIIVFSSLLVGWLLNSFCPEAAGSGIPQVKLSYWKEFGYAPRRIAWIKFIAGHEDLSDALTNGMVWRLAAFFLAGKLIATIASYGFGGCGGIFSPNLFFGGMCGSLVAGGASHFLALNQSDALLLMIGGMSACLGAVVQAPVTAVLIIFEMTHQFAVVPGLMLAVLVSQVIARSLVRHNFYDEVLLQDGHQMEHVVPPRDLRSWHNLPISAIANFSPVVLEDLSGPALRAIIDEHPYRYFPVLEDGRLKGMASRAEMEAALAEGRIVQLRPAKECRPADSIRASQTSLIESVTNTVLLTDHANGKVLAIVTLHDILRAQVSLSQR